jgi:acyl-[acyl-carrier-protein]-phospholipid O-acyltransferase/long-chain-fatty-acid--[acyl-carrier-protein] ligase
VTPRTPVAVGTVGRLLPGIEYALDPVPGVAGARLSVRPNVMLGYLLHDKPGVIQLPATERGPGWYDTATSCRSTQRGSSISKREALRQNRGDGVAHGGRGARVAYLARPAARGRSVPDAQKGEQLISGCTSFPTARQTRRRVRADGMTSRTRRSASSTSRKSRRFGGAPTIRRRRSRRRRRETSEP